MSLMKKATTTDPVAALEREQGEWRKQADLLRGQLSDQQQELAGLLAAQHGARLARVPLEKAVGAAQATVREAQEALARNIGKAGEDIHGAKLFEAQEAQSTAQEALSAFDKQHDVASMKERIAVLRQSIAQADVALRKTEDAVRSITTQIDQQVESASNAALKRIFQTMQDLLSIYEADGKCLSTCEGVRLDSI